MEDAIQYKSMVVIDEIGTMELHSMKFRELVSKVLESDKTLLCTIKENGDAFTEEIKRRKDITLVSINYENRETLPEKILEMLQATKSLNVLPSQ